MGNITSANAKGPVKAISPADKPKKTTNDSESIDMIYDFILQVKKTSKGKDLLADHIIQKFNESKTSKDNGYGLADLMDEESIRSLRSSTSSASKSPARRVRKSFSMGASGTQAKAA